MQVSFFGLDKKLSKELREVVSGFTVSWGVRALPGRHENEFGGIEINANRFHSMPYPSEYMQVTLEPEEANNITRLSIGDFASRLKPEEASNMVEVIALMAGKLPLEDKLKLATSLKKEIAKFVADAKSLE
jgi:hypothetical protein